MDDMDKLCAEIAERKIKQLEEEHLPGIRSAGCDLASLLKNVTYAKRSLDGLLHEVFSIRDLSLKIKYGDKYDRLVDKFNDLKSGVVNSCECKVKERPKTKEELRKAFKDAAKPFKDAKP